MVLTLHTGPPAHNDPSGGVRDALSRCAMPLDSSDDLDPLLDRIGDARLVLLGEASHGTSEYYTWRHRISERLIREKGFDFIAVEGDWPDCYAVNRYVRGLDGPATPRDALMVFERWPTWMWANEEVGSLVRTLEVINDAREPNERVGFYGLDVYSLWQSLHAVEAFARRTAPELLDAVRAAFHCFEPFGDVETYARAAGWGLESCERLAIEMLVSLRRKSVIGHADAEAVFDAEQNARVVQNAEHYYRIMFAGGAESWNVRDRHMAETLDRLVDRYGPQCRGIVWEHNSYIGDARATDMVGAGMTNLGQLTRERYAKDDVVLVGFGSHRGTVIAGDHWDAPYERMTVPEARAGSWEDLMHMAFHGGNRLLVLPRDPSSPLHERRGHRAIGVVYHPHSEAGNYVPTDLARRYDAFLYLDETHALQPLKTPRHADWGEHEAPETYPTGL